MSDVVAAAVANTTEAAAEPKVTKEAAPVEVKKERGPDDDFEELLKKTGGLKYKAKGKEKVVSNTAELRRLLSSRDETEAAATEQMKKAQEADSIRQKLSGLKALKPMERAKAIAELVGDERVVTEAFEELFITEHQKRQQQASLTQREREQAQRLEEQEAELERFRGESERQKQERAEQEHVAKVMETGKRFEEVTVKAFQKAKVSGEHASYFLPAVGERLDRNERLGLGISEDDVADVVMKEHRDLTGSYLKASAPPDLADLLEEAGVAKSLMEEFAKRIRAKVNGVQAAPAPIHANGHAPAQNGASDSDKRNFWKTFGNQR